MIEHSLTRITNVILILVFCLAIQTQEVFGEMAIVEDGASVAPIITAEGAPPFTQKAAEELAYYIEQISGAKPEIIEGKPAPLPDHAIWIGYQPALDSIFPKTDFDFKYPEETLIKANANHLVICGRDRWHPDHLVVKAKRETVNGVQREYGTVNAVYTFIQDQLGVRWLWPGELGEDVVTRKSIAFVPFEKRYHPPLVARAKVLTFSVLLKQSAYGQSSNWSRRQRLQLDSLDIHPGHSFKDWWERFHETHPEYFALQPDGTRSGYPSPRYVKLCVSNPDVWKQWLADVEAQIEHNPNLTIFNTAPNDSYGTGHCICDKCRAWDHPEADLRPFIWAGESTRAPAMSDRDLMFANQCGRLLKERYPDEDYFVSMNAYGNARPVPLKTKPDDNVVISNVTNNIWKVDTPDKDCLEGKTYARHYKDWGKLTKKQVWRPNTGNPAGWQSGLPDVPIERVMESFQFAMDHHCIGISVDSVLESWANQGPLYYVLARMSWDPSQNWRAVMDEYYTRGFGPAAPELKKYWMLLETARNQKVDDYPGESNGYTEVYNEAFFSEAYGLLDQAMKQAANSNEKKYAKRIEFMRIGLDHTKLASELRELSMEMLTSGKDAEVANRVRAKWNEIELNCKQQPLAVYSAPNQPGERMARAGLFHPDFMNKVKSKTVAVWKKKAVGHFGADGNSLADKTILQDARSAGWHLVFEDEFEREDLGDDWQVIEGKWKIVNGMLAGSGTLISKRGFPVDNWAGFQRLEFEAVTALPAASSKVSDLSSFIQCEHKVDDREPWKSGYYFQFGGRYNSVTQLAKADESLSLDTEKKITPKKVHKIVFENDRGEVRCFVDGKAVFIELEKRSIVSKSHNHVGFYFYTPAKIRKVKVYVKGPPDDLDLD